MPKPVQNDAGVVLMQLINQVHKVLGTAITGTGCKQTRGLVTPGAVKRMFHDRHTLHMRKTHVIHIAAQLLAQFVVRQMTVIFTGYTPPGAGMKLVNTPGGIEAVLPGTVLQPFAVAPGVIQISHHRGDIGRPLPSKGEGIAFGDLIVVLMRSDKIFINRTTAETADKPFPYAGTVIAGVQRITVRVPVVEITHHGDRSGIRCPHRKQYPCLGITIAKMRTELVIQTVMIALLEQVNVMSC
jgi:hypothetical protein